MKTLRQTLSDTVSGFFNDWSLPRQMSGLDPLYKAAESTTSRALRPRLE
jgi:formate dehydrogenase major subunit